MTKRKPTPRGFVAPGRQVLHPDDLDHAPGTNIGGVRDSVQDSAKGRMAVQLEHRKATLKSRGAMPDQVQAINVSAASLAVAETRPALMALAVAGWWAAMPRAGRSPHCLYSADSPPTCSRRA